MEAQIFAEMHKRRIVFLNCYSGQVSLDAAPEANPEPIFLKYTGNHFDVYLEKLMRIKLMRGLVQEVN